MGFTSGLIVDDDFHYRKSFFGTVQNVTSCPECQREIELLSPDENVETSVLYQNPYWPTTINGTAIE